MKWLLQPLTAVFMLITPATAFAGYVAELRPIGFSKDGKVFAFEEFFVEPENGNAFSNIFFLDTEKNTPLAGSPIKGSAGNVDDIRGARSQAAAKAAPLIKKYNLQSDPGNLVGFAPVSEINATSNSLRYYAFPTLPPVGDSYTLTLEKLPLPVSDACPDTSGPVGGFRLALTEIHGEPGQLKVYEDTSLPKDRNCPTGYRLAGIVTSNFHQTLQIALVQIITQGFDGENAHWLAVPFKVPAIP